MFLSSKTLYYINDYSNDGILFVNHNIVLCNHLKRGLLDCDVRRCGVNSVGYNDLLKIMTDDSQYKYMLKATGKVLDLGPNAINQNYLERRRLINLRKPIFIRLLMMVEVATKSTQLAPFGSIEPTLDIAIRECDPSNNIWSDGVEEYAQIVGIEPFAAYRELKLQLDNIQSLKMRTYGLMKLFSDKINKVTTQDEANAIMIAIPDMFIRDTWL
jgi:hypothetical protein